MKNKSTYTLYHLAALIVILFAGISCSDEFFKEPAGERISPDQYYKSSFDVVNAVKGAFIPLQNQMPKAIMLDGLRSDMMDVTPNADAYLRSINNQTFALDNPYLDASDYYKVIINVNEVLANIDKVAEIDRDFDEFLLFDTKGALYALRSWSYLQIARLYGQAAWIADNSVKLPENLSQTIFTRDVLIDKLIEELKPYIYDPSIGTERVENSIEYLMNPKAVLGELYLEKNDYINAVTYLKMACESFSNSTVLWKVDKSFTKEAWKNIFINAEYNSNERLSVVPYSSTAGQVNPLTKWMMHTAMYMVKPTQLLIDSFKTQVTNLDEVGDLYRGSGISYDMTSSGAPYISKYSLDPGEPYSTDIIISRAADLHLMLAEALNRSGDIKTALILLNAGFAGEADKPAPYFRWSSNLGIRGRALLKPRIIPEGYRDLVLTELIENYIMDERALELAFEGKRWSDLMRVANRRGKPAYLADKVAAKFGAKNTTKYNEIHTKLMNPANWYLPTKK